MARGFSTTFGSGSTDSVATNFTTLTAGVRSYAFWAYINGLGGGNLGRVFDSSTTTAGVDTLFIATGEFNYQRAFTLSTVTFQFPKPATGAWHHYCIVYDASSTSNVPTIYVDGVSQTVTVAGSASGTAVTTTNDYRLGNRESGTNRVWDGMLAEFCMWDALLTAGEVVAIAKGASPQMVRPQSIVEYVPLLRDNISKKLAAPTVTGTAVQPHPRVFYPSSRILNKYNIRIPPFMHHYQQQGVA